MKSQKKKGLRLVIVIAAFAAIGGLLFGYDTGAISGALLFIKRDLLLDDVQQEAVVAVLLLFAAISAPFAGHLADKFGRKRMIIAAAGLFIIGAFLMAFSVDYLMLLAGRAVVGAAIGTASMTVPLYISEISPASIRGMCVSLNQLMVTIGILAAFLVDLGFVHGGQWRWMLGISAIPALLLFTVMIFLPKSPRWLMSLGKRKEAEGIFNKLGNTPEETDVSVQRIETQLERKDPTWKQVFAPATRPAIFAGIFLAVLQQLTGINTIIYYAPTMLATVVKESDTAAILSTVGIGAVNVTMTVLALFLIDRWGRRPLLLFGTSLMAIALIGLGIANAMPDTVMDSLGWIFNIALFIYIAGFAIGLGPIAWLFLAEVYPLEIRGKAMSCGSFANWASNFIVAMTFLTILNYLGPSITFLMYGIICIFTIIFIYKYIPETKGKSLEEIQAFWQ